MADERGMTVFEVDTDENIEDAFLLVHILAVVLERREKISLPSAGESWIFSFRNPGQYFRYPFKIAGVLLCPIGRPWKGAKYQNDAEVFRKHFRGICEDAGERLYGRLNEFQNCLRLGALFLVERPEDVIDRQFSDFFLSPRPSAT
jgi:hypothetical protein